MMEVEAPTTSVWSVREGAHLLSEHGDPYASRLVRHPPLLLLLLHAADERGLLPALLLCAHVATAWMVSLLTHGRAASRLVGVALLACPWSVAACLELSSVCVPHALTLAALVAAHRARTVSSAAALALAAYSNPDATWLVPAVALLCASRAGSGSSESSRHRRGASAVFVGWFACWLAALLLGSRAALGSWGFVDAVYGAWVRADTPRPNVGLWWYLSLEAFPRERSPLVIALHVVPRLCVAPLALRLRRSPLLAACWCAALLGAVGPYALAPDATLSLALIASQLVGAPPLPAAALRAQLSTLAPAAFVGAVVALGMLAPLRRGWLERRTLNANFYYAATVAHGAAQTYLLYDVAAAAVARDLRLVLPPAATRIQRVWRRHRPRGAPKRGRRRRKSE